MISAEQLFVWDLDALREVVKNPQPIHILDSSNRLRRLLTDTTGPLIHKVARGRDFKARFAVPTTFHLPPELQKHMVFHWTDMSLAAKTEPVSLDKFLSTVIVMHNNSDFTVKHLINYSANAAGGVHHGDPRDKDKGKEIHASAQLFMIKGHPFPFASLLSIVKVTIDALNPLYLMLRA